MFLFVWMTLAFWSHYPADMPAQHDCYAQMYGWQYLEEEVIKLQDLVAPWPDGEKLREYCASNYLFWSTLLKLLHCRQDPDQWAISYQMIIERVGEVGFRNGWFPRIPPELEIPDDAP